MGCPCRSADKRAVLSPALVVLPQAMLTAGWWPPNSAGKCSKGKGKPQLPTAVTCSCSHWFPVHKWEMTSDELCARDLIKLNAAPDRKDYSDVRFLRKCGTKVWAVPLSVESDSIGLPEKLLKVKTDVICLHWAYGCLKSGFGAAYVWIEQSDWLLVFQIFSFLLRMHNPPSAHSCLGAVN